MLMDILYFVMGGVAGGIAAFVFTRKYMMKQIKENPPVNEKMIRAMYMQMGRKPSEAQIKATMNAMNKYR